MIDPFWLSLAAKMVTSAVIVVAASLLVERSGPFMGAMVATLPTSAGPSYAFLAMEHGPIFLERSTLSSLAINAGTAVFIVTYATLARRRSLLASLAVAMAIWLASAIMITRLHWTLPSALALNLVCLPGCFAIARKSLRPPPQKGKLVGRQWWEVPARALLVMALVAVVVLSGRLFGPAVAGIAAVAPVVMTSLVLVLHNRMGGPAAAAVLANSIPGIVGFAMGIVVIHLTAVSLGAVAALLLGLGVCVVWNVGLVVLRRPST